MTFGLFACLLGVSTALMGGSMQFLEACFVSVILVRDLTPNTGLFWYMFTEVFQRYYLLFIFAFHAHILFYSVPLHLRLGCYGPTGPFIHCGAALGMITLFRPYPTASDYGLMLSAMLVQAELIKESQQYFAFLLSGVMFGLSMVPTMVAVWLGRNAGNANYLYNMTLVVNVFGSLTLSQWVKAGMRLRKRQHQLSFFRKLVLDIVEEVLVDPKAAQEKAAALVADDRQAGSQFCLWRFSHRRVETESSSLFYPRKNWKKSRRLKEGLFFLENGISPYVCDTCHYPPLLLLFLNLLDQVSPLAHFTFLVLVDLATALLLRKLPVLYRQARQAAGGWAEASLGTLLADPCCRH
eukprot:symbB.v1.2.039331.t1/scaffold6493.1/size17610/1